MIKKELLSLNTHQVRFFSTSKLTLQKNDESTSNNISLGENEVVQGTIENENVGAVAALFLMETRKY